MSALAYIREFVDPAIRGFEANPHSRRHAVQACVAVFQCIEHLAYPKNSASLRDQFRKESADFAMVDRVANAFKHVKSGHMGSPRNQPLELTAVFERPPAMAGIMQCGLSQCGDGTGGVAVWGEGGPDLLRVVTRAAEFLRAKCDSPTLNHIKAGVSRSGSFNENGP